MTREDVSEHSLKGVCFLTMNSTTIRIFIVFFLMCSLSCQRPPQINLVQEDIEFQTNFEPTIKCSGSYYDEIHHAELVYFADYNSAKCLKIFDFEGNLKDSVPLDEVISRRYVIDAIIVFARDTILVNSFYPTNFIKLMDFSGHVWRTIDLDSLQGRRDDGREVECWRSYVPNSMICQDYTVYLSYNLNEFSVENDDYMAAYKNFYRTRNESPYFLKVTSVFDNPQVSLELDNYFYYFHDDPEDEVFTLPFFSLNDSLVFLFTPGSDKVLYYARYSPEKPSVFTIKSDYTAVGFPPTKVTDDYLDGTGENWNTKAQTSGGVSRFFYNKKGNFYYLSCTHSKPENKTREENYYDRPFSIQILNEDFQKIAEFDYSYRGYSFSSEIPTENGVLLRKRNDSIPRYKNEKLAYTHIKFSR